MSYIVRLLTNDYESDSDWDDDDDDNYDNDDGCIDEMLEIEIDFLDSMKENNKYYLGIYNKYDSQLLLGTCISVNTFFRYSPRDVLKYLVSFNIMCPESAHNKIEILKTCYTYDNIHMCIIVNVIVKTFWLKLFQRKCRKYIQQKIANDIRKKQIKVQRYFEVWGKYPPSLASLNFY